MLLNKTFSFYGVVLFLVFSQGWAQKTIEVFSTDVPWNTNGESRESSKIYSIQEAVDLASPGDKIVVHEGIYRETIVIDKDDIDLSNYENDYVLVTGTELVSNWNVATNMVNGVMKADVSKINMQTDYSQLFDNGQMQQIGRHPNNTSGKMMEVIHPNGGYALLNNCQKAAGANAPGQVTFDEHPLPNRDLSGGVVRAMTGKMRHYVYGNITGNSGNTVSFRAINSNTDWAKDGAIASTRFKFSWGFVLHKNLVDIPGEWFIDEGTLYYFPPEGTDLKERRIEIQVREKVLVLNNTSGVGIQGIHFHAGNVDMRNVQQATIKESSFRYLHPFWTPGGYGQNSTDQTGIYLENSSGNTFRNLYVAHSWGNMFAVHGGQNNTFTNCIIKDHSWVGIFSSGIHLRGSENAKIQNCTFGEAGRFQIRLDGEDAKVTILDSDFYGAMKMGEDAGPLEATSTGKIGSLDLKGGVIAYNRVHDVTGLPVSDNYYNKQKIVAFYMEDTENYTAHHNLVYNFKADNYTGPVDIERVGEFLYMGPRYNRMQEKVHYYNNTIWNYDELLSIWSIPINNWQELGIPQSENIGSLEDGHFANNIFQTGSTFRFNQVNANMTATGALQGFVNHPNNEKLETTDFDLYIERTSANNYHLNPENNLFFPMDQQASLFADPSEGNFTLLPGSAGVGCGIEIPGITSTATPDCGALEGGDRVLHAGADINTPAFLEKTASDDEDPVSLESMNHQVAHSKLWYEASIEMLYLPASLNGWQIYSLNGRKLVETTADQLNMSAYPKGVYILHSEDATTQILRID